ncbi:MAG: hydroxyisourate hydrolase [Arenicellales bacterium WSBS_2016_MAG_OTU3]
MATISSHVLNSVTGDHAGGIVVELFRLHENRDKEKIFSVTASSDGRIAETVDLRSNESKGQYELEFNAAKYFAKMAVSGGKKQNMDVVVVRLKLDDDKAKYHIPMMLSPHSYSVWWPGK